jgi:hypothetical protein
MIKMVMHYRVKYGIKRCGERARQQRDKEGKGERCRAFMKMSDGIRNKFEHWRKYLWQMLEDNPRQSR